MMSFGQLLKETREARGLSAAEVAQATGHSPSWLSDWERDKKTGPMPPYEMTQLSRVLGLPMRELVTASGYALDEDDQPPMRPGERRLAELATKLTDVQLGFAVGFIGSMTDFRTGDDRGDS